MIKRNEVPNCIVSIAEKHGRNYVTADDVAEAFLVHADDPHFVRIDALELLAGRVQMRLESFQDCALVAWKGCR